MRRRDILAGLGATALAGNTAHAADADRPALTAGLPEGVRETAQLTRVADKRALIKLSYRPPNYESTLAAFSTPITAPDQFFVRYHLPLVPVATSLNGWRLKIGGDAAGQALQFSITDLQWNFKQADVIAVCQCAGNRRGLSSPHVPGVQWGPGAMGNALWRGPRLKDVLTAAGVKPGAVEVALVGADQALSPATPAYRKSIPIAKALEDDVILAYAMNGQQLPQLNGFPLRLVVPGWTSTYWMKHLTELEIRTKPLDSFWMQKAYRVPKDMFPVDLPFASQADATTVPVTEIVVNSLITNLMDGAHVPASGFVVQGIAWDRGHGIKAVDVSLDGGKSWRGATLDTDIGRYSFRVWTFNTGRVTAGALSVVARATSQSGETQSETLKFNSAGYHNNVPLPVTVKVV
jgi:sulfite dehydrogenase